VERRQFLARAGAIAGGLSAGALVGAGGEVQVAPDASGSWERPRGDDTGRAANEREDDRAEREEDEEEVADPRRGTQEIVWSVATGASVAALTFDDGPHPALTPTILDVLDRYGVKATFMVMGHAVEQHRDLALEIVARGHEIGNHTWSHLHVAKTSAATARREIERGTEILEGAGLPVRLFRPPQGRLSEDVLRLVTELNQDIVLWSVTRGEKRWVAPDEVARHVVAETGPGDIIDLHDGIGRGTFAPGTTLADTLMGRRQVEVQALPSIIEQLLGRGLDLATVSALRLVRGQGLTMT
jgi:peptidoglycan/xylan/chitin deacetylase (PgdA/CDA1 family)